MDENNCLGENLEKNRQKENNMIGQTCTNNYLQLDEQL